MISNKYWVIIARMLEPNIILFGSAWQAHKPYTYPLLIVYILP